MRKSNIKLTMREYRNMQIYANIFNGLTLSLVYSHSKSQMNRLLEKVSGGFADMLFVAKMTKHECQQWVVVGSNGVDSGRIAKYLCYVSTSNEENMRKRR